MRDFVECASHGRTAPAFICGHALAAFIDERKQPFYWTDVNAPEPCGWCEECQERYIQAGEEWVGEADEKLDAKLICVECFKNVIQLNGYS